MPLNLISLYFPIFYDFAVPYFAQGQGDTYFFNWCNVDYDLYLHVPEQITENYYLVFTPRPTENTSNSDSVKCQTEYDILRYLTDLVLTTSN